MVVDQGFVRNWRPQSSIVEGGFQRDHSIDYAKNNIRSPCAPAMYEYAKCMDQSGAVNQNQEFERSESIGPKNQTLDTLFEFGRPMLEKVSVNDAYMFPKTFQAHEANNGRVDDSTCEKYKEQYWQCRANVPEVLPPEPVRDDSRCPSMIARFRKCMERHHGASQRCLGEMQDLRAYDCDKGAIAVGPTNEEYANRPFPGNIR